MRIAIVCNGRCGSTSMFNYINYCLLSQHKKYNTFFEPFNFRNKSIINEKHFKIDKIINKKNVLLKTFIDIQDYPYESFENSTDYWNWFYSFFDKIIVLERKNKRLQAESFVYHIKLSKNRTVSPYWHTPKYYDLTEDDETDVIELTKYLESESLVLQSISERGYPLFYYEDIFVDKNQETINKLNEYCEIEYNQPCIDGWINSPYKKVRIEEKTNKLI
jgi:hypothetical protein